MFFRRGILKENIVLPLAFDCIMSPIWRMFISIIKSKLLFPKNSAASMFVNNMPFGSSTSKDKSERLLFHVHRLLLLNYISYNFRFTGDVQ